MNRWLSSAAVLTSWVAATAACSSTTGTSNATSAGLDAGDGSTASGDAQSAGGGSDDGSAPRPDPAAGGCTSVKVCAILTLDDFTKAIGTKAVTETEQALPAGDLAPGAVGSHCTGSATDQGGLDATPHARVQYYCSNDTQVSNLDSKVAREDAVNRGDSVSDIPGLGDSAFYASNPSTNDYLTAFVGAHIRVDISFDRITDSSLERPQGIALARKLIESLYPK